MNLLTIKELSQLLNVKQSKLYLWVYNGSIPSYKLNGLVRFDMEEIEKWIKDSKLVSVSVINSKTQIYTINKNNKNSSEKNYCIY